MTNPSADASFLDREGTDRRLSERRIHPAVAMWAVRENAWLVKQVTALREALEAMLGVEDSVTSGQEHERRAVAVPQARSVLLVTAPHVSAQQEGKL